MYLLEYIEYINEFPAPLIIFSEKEQSKKILHMYTIVYLYWMLHSHFAATYAALKYLVNYPMIELPINSSTKN